MDPPLPLMTFPWRNDHAKPELDLPIPRVPLRQDEAAGEKRSGDEK